MNEQKPILLVLPFPFAYSQNRSFVGRNGSFIKLLKESFIQSCSPSESFRNMNRGPRKILGLRPHNTASCFIPVTLKGRNNTNRGENTAFREVTKRTHDYGYLTPEKQIAKGTRVQPLRNKPGNRLSLPCPMDGMQMFAIFLVSNLACRLESRCFLWLTLCRMLQNPISPVHNTLF